MTNFNNSNQISTLLQFGLEFYVASWIDNHIIYPFIAYCLPVLLSFTILTNIVVILIFIKCKDVNKRIKPSMRVYYIATAIGDVLVCIPFHLTFFLGTILAK